MMEPAHINGLNVVHSETALSGRGVVCISDANRAVNFLVEPS